jgi:hypothetical protein
LAVNAGAVATPLLLVVAVALATPAAKLPLGPLAGAVNVTIAPLTGLLFASFTVACSAVANAVLTVALCGVPAVAVMLAADTLEAASAIPFRVTLPPPKTITHVTFKVCPAVAALYVRW